MKAILEYDLSNPEQQAEHYRAIMSLKMAIALHEFADQLRSRVKYGDVSQEVYDALDEVREQFHQILQENGLILDNLLQ
jgi:division protein CdvB (Snf7/Vps24/ESCRT-III family)